jgi:hypothetical protein
MQYSISEEWRATDVGAFPSDAVRGQFVAEITTNEVLVVWTETNNETVYARTMDSDALEVKSTVQIDDGTVGLDEDDIGACILQNGNIVVTWASDNEEPGFVILNGTTLSVIKAWTDIGDATWYGNQPYAATLNNGNFVIAWNEDDSLLGQFRIMDEDGNFVTAVTPFYNPEEARNPNIAVLNDGRFVITFFAYDQDEIYFVKYNENGTLDTGPTIISDFHPGTSNEGQRGTIPLSDGGWFTTYEGNNGLFASVYNADSTSADYQTTIMAAGPIEKNRESSVVLTDEGTILISSVDIFFGVWPSLYMWIYDTNLNQIQAITKVVTCYDGTGVRSISMANFHTGVPLGRPSTYAIMTGDLIGAGSSNIFNCVRNDYYTKWESKFDDTHWHANMGVWSGSVWNASGINRLMLCAIGSWFENYRPLSIRITFTGASTFDSHLFVNDDDGEEIADGTDAGSTDPITLLFINNSWENLDLADCDDYNTLNMQATSHFTVENIEFEVPMGGDYPCFSSSSSSISSSSTSSSSLSSSSSSSSTSSSSTSSSSSSSLSSSSSSSSISVSSSSTSVSTSSSSSSSSLSMVPSFLETSGNFDLLLINDAGDRLIIDPTLT